MKRALAIVVAVAVLAVTGFVGYGWWTRRGAPTFSVGGEFTSASQPSQPPAARLAASGAAGGSTATATTSIGDAHGSPATGGRSGTGPGTGGGRAARGGGAGGPSGPVEPAEGSYVYGGSGRTDVDFGGASACGWDIETVTSEVRHDGDDVIVDWRYHENQVERHVNQVTPRGVFTSFVGAAVTCAGVRRTTEDRYDPPTMRFPYPLEVGKTWSVRADTGERREDVRGRVAKRDRISVPSGTYDAFEIALDVTITGEQDGTYRTTFWFAPSIGRVVKEWSKIDVQAGNARFVSEWNIALRELPA